NDHAAGDRRRAPHGDDRSGRRQSGHCPARARRPPRPARAPIPVGARRRMDSRPRRRVQADARAGMRVLAGDIGGTHARLAVVDIDDQQVRLVREARYPSADYPSLSPIVRRTLDERQLSREVGIPSARLLNDLDAIARGIARLDSRDMITLQAGAPDETGVLALIGAGTGLGEAFVVREGRRVRTRASEGGHSGFAPRTPLERDLLAWLATEFDHVSA